MLSPKPGLRSGLFLLLTSFLMAPAIAHSVGPVFLGTNPVVVGKAPVPAGNIGSLGVDAVGNHYYADTVAGRVIEVAPSGTITTIATGLSQPLIAVNFLGDVFVADTGTSRVLKIAALPTRTTSVLASVTKLHALALDNGNNLFLLSGDQLVEIPVNGSPMAISTIPGASLLGMGPGADAKGHLYIVSAQSGGYSAELYTYSYSGGIGKFSGPLKNFLPNLAGAPLGGIFVDPQGDILTEATVAGRGKIVISSTSGYKQALVTTSIPTVPMAQDAIGNLYYVNGPNLIKIQLGAVNFDAQYSRDGTGFPETQITLNFGRTPNVHWVISQEPTGGQFYEGDLSSGSGPLVDASQLHFYFYPAPRIVGSTTGIINITDLNNVTTLSIPLVATAINGGYEAYYLPAPNLKAHPLFQPVTKQSTTPVVVPAVLSRCSCGTFALNRETGVITRDGQQIVSGLLNVRGADVDGRGNLYVTQQGVTGVLRVAADGSSSRIATDIAYPNGSAMDGLGNLFVLDGDNIVRVAPDGSEVVFATPATNGGYTVPLSIAVDLFYNVYAGYATSPNGTRGAILKFSAVGAYSLVPTDTKRPTGLAVYPCGALFFADAERGTLAVVPGNKLEKYIGFGLINPINLHCAEGGAVSGEDAAIPGGQFTLSPITLLFQDTFNYDFGKVTVGSSRSITLSAVSVGASAYTRGPAGSATFYGSPDPNFTPNDTIFATALTEINLSFSPFEARPYGPFQVQISDQNDGAAFILNVINLTGTGVSAPLQAAAQ